MESDEELVHNAKKFCEKELIEGFSMINKRLKNMEKRKFRFKNDSVNVIQVSKEV